MTGIRLDGKRALITGATKGIGADIAKAFAAAGATISPSRTGLRDWLISLLLHSAAWTSW
jgi:NAD(P)-dependent dehydrogenase (short-subunit alcohol dehydrogenase family)